MCNNPVCRRREGPDEWWVPWLNDLREVVKKK